jgi:hypothetical protein
VLEDWPQTALQELVQKRVRRPGQAACPVRHLLGLDHLSPQVEIGVYHLVQEPQQRDESRPRRGARGFPSSRLDA